jgi:probable HAF family extracellular repeat protein
MATFRSLSSIFHRSKVKRQPATRRLVLEVLEDRLCPSSTVLDLGTLGGTYSNASAVNASGQVVGGSETAAGAGYNHAFLWQNGAMTDLGTLGGPRSGATDINDAGQIVGLSIPAGATMSHAFLWQNGGMTDLGTLGGDFSNAQAINNHGQIVGVAKTAGGAFHDFVWEGGVMYDLDALLPANSGWATKFDTIDINDNRQIAGTGLFNGVQRAFLISDNDGTFANGGLTITNLGTLAAGSSSGDAINNLGQVVGWSNVANGNPHAFRYSGGMMTDLKTLIGNPTIGVNVSYANAINDAGQIVGTATYDPWAFPSPTYHAVIWQNGKINDLNKQLPRGSAWALESANGINGRGQIVGQGMIGGQRHAFLMVPSGSTLQAVVVSNTAGAAPVTPNTPVAMVVFGGGEIVPFFREKRTVVIPVRALSGPLL